MGSFVTLLGVVAASVAVAALARYPAVAAVLGRARPVAFWPLLALFRLASVIADFFLSPKGYRQSIAAWRWLLWIVAAALPVAIFSAGLAWAPSLPGLPDLGCLLILAASFYALLVGAAFVIVYDDIDVMDGVIETGARRIRGKLAATRPAVLALSSGLFVAYVIAIAWWLSGVPLVDRAPGTGFTTIDTVLVGLHALPTNLIFGMLDRLTGSDTSVVFHDSLVAQTYAFAVNGAGLLLVACLVAMGVEGRRQLRRLVREIGESDKRRETLLPRILLAPPAIRRGILRAAIIPGAIEKQKRLILAAKDIGMLSLPSAFCRHIEMFDSEIQVFGLDQCLELFRYRARDFDAEECVATFNAAGRALKRGKLAAEPMKKLLRLMSSIVIVKRGGVTIPASARAMVATSIRAELEKPRAREDAALRGFLRDLQSALAGSPPAVKPVPAEPREAWVRRPPMVVDPSVRPEIPKPTVH